MPASRSVPAYRLHKSTGRAVVRLNGRDFYLGEHNTPKSREKYNRLVGEWIAGNRQPPPAAVSTGDRITVAELCIQYLAHAEEYYRSPSKEPSAIRQALRPLVDLYGSAAGDDFGPVEFEAVCQAMVREGWCRKYVNKQLCRLKAMFKWAKQKARLPDCNKHEQKEHRLALVQAFDGIRDLPGLKYGRTDARESAKVKPIHQAFVDAVLDRVSPQVGAMIKLQLLTSMPRWRQS